MLNSKERAKLRSIASTMDASTIIGINGVTDNVIDQIKMDFSNKELCKVKVLPNCGNVVKDYRTFRNRYCCIGTFQGRFDHSSKTERKEIK